MAVLFSIAAPAAVPVARVRREVLLDSSPAAAVPCIQRAAHPAAPLEVPVPVSVSVPASVPVPALAARVLEWEALLAWFRLRARLRVRNVQAARSVAVASNIRRPKKAR